jgi:hypothetical protein
MGVRQSGFVQAIQSLGAILKWLQAGMIQKDGLAG